MQYLRRNLAVNNGISVYISITSYTFSIENYYSRYRIVGENEIRMDEIMQCYKICGNFSR